MNEEEFTSAGGVQLLDGLLRHAHEYIQFETLCALQSLFVQGTKVLHTLAHTHTKGER